MTATQLVWLRNDLRLDDNPAIYHAQQRGDIRIVFIATPQQWLEHYESPAKLGLKASVLNDLSQRLSQLGIPFDILETDFFKAIPDLLLAYCQQNGVQTVWFNQETPLNERRRDHAVATLLTDHAIGCEQLAPDLIVSSPVLTQQGQPYKVFTPFYRRWLQILTSTEQIPFSEPKKQATTSNIKNKAFLWAGTYRKDLWNSSEDRMLAALDKFCEHQLAHYKTHRDLPALSATSGLSPYLSLGLIGPRRLVSTIQYYCALQQSDWQHDDWLRELAWRDFYRQLLLYFPDLSKGKAFQTETENVPWQQDDAGFEAWCQGKTGYPIVDAAMQQLRQTGWMHNRLRMITASFLTKLLLIDWRQGETFFMQQLIDGDYAANNGGWQWSASTGVDAVPYFRVFNPIRQSEKFDPEGKFIKRFVPELSTLTGQDIHWPSDQQRVALNYPAPIVDYNMARKRAIAAFANVSE